VQRKRDVRRTERRRIKAAMSERLAVFTPQVGAVSETFVRRHVEDLLPGRTVVIARWSPHQKNVRWLARCPVLFLNKWGLRLPVRLARRAGISERRLYNQAVRWFLRQYGVDVALIEYLDQFVDFVPLLDFMNIPYVVQGHGIDVSASLRQEGMAQRYLVYKSARTVLTRSELHRRRLIDLGLPPDKVHVNPGGVDLSPTPERNSDAAKRLLAVGRMTTKKGPIYLLEAFRLAASQDPGLTLDYVGAGELLPAARQFVGACGLHSRIRLHGAASDEVKRRLFEQCGIFVQHSITDPETGDEEGLPASIQEAMAYGLAVISTRHAGIPDAVENGTTGLLVDEGDSQAMAKAILKISGECDLHGRMGAAGHRKAEALYTWPAERSRLFRYLGLAEHGTSKRSSNIVTAEI
jgi:glycosyltransferase involved in cell wall biosynthesis